MGGGSGGGGKGAPSVQQATPTPAPPEPEVWITEYNQDADGKWVSSNSLVKESEVDSRDQTLVTDHKQLPSGQWEAFTKAVLKTEADQYKAHEEKTESSEDKKKRMPTLLTSSNKDTLGETPVEKKSILGV